MANLVETPAWEEGIYQLETTDPVLGGADGIDNLQAKQLGNRTAWLKQQVDALSSGAAGMATETYVKNAINALDSKQSVRAATTASITLSGVQTVDGVSLLVGDRVLVKDQGVASQNGLYVVSGNSWSRAADADATVEVTAGLTVYVEEGTKQGKSRWQVVTTGAITLGTTAITFQLVPAGLQGSTLRSINLTTTTVNLTADDAGSVIAITGSGGGTLVLPAASSVMAGEMIAIRCNNTDVSTNTLKGAGADTIGGTAGAGANTAVLNPYDCMVLVSDGVSKWDIAIEATMAFVSKMFSRRQQLSANGYQKLPGGLVIQWGQGKTSASGSATVSMPISFTDSPFSIVCTPIVSLPLNVSLGFISETFGSFKVYTTSASTGSPGAAQSLSFHWMAIGI